MSECRSHKKTEKKCGQVFLVVIFSVFHSSKSYTRARDGEVDQWRRHYKQYVGYATAHHETSFSINDFFRDDKLRIMFSVPYICRRTKWPPIHDCLMYFFLSNVQSKTSRPASIDTDQLSRLALGVDTGHMTIRHRGHRPARGFISRLSSARLRCRLLGPSADDWHNFLNAICSIDQ